MMSYNYQPVRFTVMHFANTLKALRLSPPISSWELDYALCLRYNTDDV